LEGLPDEIHSKNKAACRHSTDGFLRKFRLTNTYFNRN
jgi:hypothetical protein